MRVEPRYQDYFIYFPKGSYPASFMLSYKDLHWSSEPNLQLAAQISLCSSVLTSCLGPVWVPWCMASWFQLDAETWKSILAFSEAFSVSEAPLILFSSQFALQTLEFFCSNSWSFDPKSSPPSVRHQLGDFTSNTPYQVPKDWDINVPPPSHHCSFFILVSFCQDHSQCCMQ